MKILFWIVVFVLVATFTLALFNSTATKDAQDRQTDLTVGVIVFLCFVIFVRVFGGYIV